jgi:hypothetical protein
LAVAFNTELMRIDVGFEVVVAVVEKLKLRHTRSSRRGKLMFCFLKYEFVDRYLPMNYITL